MVTLKKYLFNLIYLIPIGICCSLAMVSASSAYSHSSTQLRPITLAYANEFVFSPRKHKWYAYDGSGRVINSGRASGGKGYCPDIGRSCKTRSGTFRVISKGSPGCKSTRYPVGRGGAPMPYCMFYSKYYAVHGSYDVPSHNASHGCIRVRPDAARWLSKNFMRIGTRVTILPY